MKRTMIVLEFLGVETRTHIGATFARTISYIIQSIITGFSEDFQVIMNSIILSLDWEILNLILF